MNNLQCKVMNYIYEKANKEELDLEKLNDEFFEYLEKFKLYYPEPSFSKEEFFLLISSVYSVFKLKIDNGLFLERMDTYVKLLLADILDGRLVDIKWCIDKLFYFALARGQSIEVNEAVSKIKNDIIYIQDMLYKEFAIGESIKDKVGRKIYTNYMIRLG